MTTKMASSVSHNGILTHSRRLWTALLLQATRGARGAAAASQTSSRPDPELRGLPGSRPDPELQGLLGSRPDPELQGLPGSRPDPELQGLPGSRPDPELQGLPGSRNKACGTSQTHRTKIFRRFTKTNK
ncbi:uncharacterized protein V6R79_013212 [Siganus canaliculatus]